MDSKIGFAAFMHPKRNCVYDEAKTILALGKDTKNNINRHLQHLYDSKMPENYGLLECCMLCRENHNSLCVEIMDSWWQEFLNYSKRDQLSLPYILFNKNISVDLVGVLGNDIQKDSGIRRIPRFMEGF